MLKHQLDKPHLDIIAPARNVQKGVVLLQTKMDELLQQSLTNPQSLDEEIKAYFYEVDPIEGQYLYPPQFNRALDYLCTYNEWPSLSGEEKEYLFREADTENDGRLVLDKFKTAALKVLTKIAYEEPPEQEEGLDL